MTSRQYVQEAWHPVTVRRGGQSVACNFSPAPGADSATLCIVLTGASHLEEAVGIERTPDIVATWLDRLAAAGTNVLLVHGKCFDDLWRMAAEVRAGRDVFVRSLERMRIVVEHSVAHGYGAPDRIVAMGVSRYGFAVLRAMADIPGIAAAVAHQPVTWWPRLREFRGMDDSAIVLAHSLFEFAERLPPRPVFVQTGYDDRRLGQDWTERAVHRMAEVYEAAGSGRRFTHDLMDIPGHTDAPMPASALDNVVAWMREHRVVRAGRMDGRFGPASHRKP